MYEWQADGHGVPAFARRAQQLGEGRRLFGFRSKDTAVPDGVVQVPRELLVSLVDEDECSFDHHGGCRAHGYLTLGPGELCPQMELKRRLA